MGKPTHSNFNVLDTPREESDLHQDHEPHADQMSPPRHLRQCGLASASQAIASGGGSLVERRAREHLSLHGQTDEPLPNVLQPHDHLPSWAVEQAFDTNTRDRVTVCPTDANRCHSTFATTKISAEPVPKSTREGLNSVDKPRVKVLLYGNDHDYFSTSDIECVRGICLKYVKGIHRDNIRVHSGGGPMGKEFDWFFDPDDIAPGGLLILCVTGHGIRTIHGVDIRMNKCGPKLMDSLDLYKGINRLQVPCTLEVVLGTCNAEATISGLDRLLWMQVSDTPEKHSAALPSLSALFRTLDPSCFVPKLATKAIIIVWAAAVDGGLAYEEMDLPGRVGTNDIMIGAICKALESAGQNLSRRVLFRKIDEAASEYNTARDEKYLGQTKEEQRKARDSGKYGDPQLICLLSSPENRELVLDGLAFEAINGIATVGSLSVKDARN